MTEPLLEVQQVIFGYQREPILRGVSLEVRTGELACIIGPNGSGKSTLIKTIMGYIHPWVGKIRLAGEEITGQAPHQIIRRGVTAILQGRTTFGTLTVRENLELGGYTLHTADRRQRIGEVFEQFPVLWDKQRLRASSLSSGEQKMVEISRALMIRPQLLLLDEPTIGLSPKMAEQFFQSILELKRQSQTVLIIEQNARSTLEVSDYAYVLDRGELRFADAAAKILANEEVRRSYLGMA